MIYCMKTKMDLERNTQLNKPKKQLVVQITATIEQKEYINWHDETAC